MLIPVTVRPAAPWRATVHPALPRQAHTNAKQGNATAHSRNAVSARPWLPNRYEPLTSCSVTASASSVTQSGV